MEVGEDEDMMAEDIIMCEGAEAVAVGGGRDELDIGTCDEEVPVYYSPHQHQVCLVPYCLLSCMHVMRKFAPTCWLFALLMVYI